MVIHYNLREQVLNDIGRQILGGKLEPGDVLPKEDTLSEQYGVSRTVIREAVKGLAARGLVTSRPKVGTIVRPRDEWQMLDPAVLEWVANSEEDGEFMMRLAEARLAIEPVTAELAARHATPEDLERIEAAFNHLETVLDDEEAWSHADLEFHASIVAACRNEFLAYIVRSLRRPLYSRRRINVSLMKLLNSNPTGEGYDSARDEVLSRHRAVLDAIGRHDDLGAHRAAKELLERVIELMTQTRFEPSS
jgi:DNA-binding FadR family transcriptional regulator